MFGTWEPRFRLQTQDANVQMQNRCDFPLITGPLGFSCLSRKKTRVILMGSASSRPSNRERQYGHTGKSM